MQGNKAFTIGPGSLVSEVLNLKHDNYRLVQICATKTENGYELTYSFAREYDLKNLRMNISPGTEILSISNIYEPAFLYENEIHDLFGIDIKMMTLDYEGNLYRIKDKTPFK
ncbi:hypothetical protein CE91St36_08280 [Christensenellaceae bacterium]|nr:hypothetical protein CE91St36_08280 [Christensenellaceae bacterium]BDF60679.1 hypothetical protein CE91St37_08290 [Christensenellaceae bacterium]